MATPTQDRVLAQIRAGTTKRRDIQRNLHMSEDALRHILFRMVRAGRVRRVARGFYEAVEHG